MKMTVERRFLPGIGIVREDIITGLAGGAVSRQEIPLQSLKRGETSLTSR